jgi:hypothetical protein
MQRINYHIPTLQSKQDGRTANPHLHGSSDGIVIYPRFFVEVVDEGLDVLGEAPKKAIYELLEADYAMQRDEIPMRFIEFSKVLRDNMGRAVDPLLEFIVDSFFLKLHIEPPKWTDLDDGIGPQNGSYETISPQI